MTEKDYWKDLLEKYLKLLSQYVLKRFQLNLFKALLNAVSSNHFQK